MSTVEQSIDVEVPVSAAYNQWTQFETFPQFMEGVERIDQVSDTMTHWVTEIAGQKREFDAEITEQHPDERVAWKSVDGTTQAGVVTFHRLDPNTTRIMVQMDYSPDGFVEQVGDKLGFVERRVKGDLERFKRFIESRGGNETGAWRGNVDAPPTA
ncbi:SRPBCC family protein [Motilibacter aurantiacus]|uniref:SRPBCC family protein n=1 Tax=Motilibacter aurantiacus TaxID=2714955 RepID=UPI0014091AD3|nr:SRPBCC family protein [Motilibacter aurantiacus]NHC45366.1 SRPBCC family protein [Motilibacter aurantiacus]